MEHVCGCLSQSKLFFLGNFSLLSVGTCVSVSQPIRTQFLGRSCAASQPMGGELHRPLLPNPGRHCLSWRDCLMSNPGRTASLEQFWKTLSLEHSLEELPLEHSLERLPLEHSLEGLPLQHSLEGLPHEQSWEKLVLEQSLEGMTLEHKTWCHCMLSSCWLSECQVLLKPLGVLD